MILCASEIEESVFAIFSSSAMKHRKKVIFLVNIFPGKYFMLKWSIGVHIKSFERVNELVICNQRT